MATYSDSEMRAIMGRALQIDSGRSDRFTPEQLRTIAAELGISTQALEVAMYEADSKGVSPAFNQPVPARGGWAKGVAIAVALLVVAALGLGFMRNAGRDAPRISTTQAPVSEAGPRTLKTAPARVKTAPPATEPVEPAAHQPTPKKIATKKVVEPPQ